MKKTIIACVALMLITSLTAFAQSGNVEILEARRSGVKMLKGPEKGILKVDVSGEYRNLVQVDLCGFRGSVALACRESYDVTMTTATGRKFTITDYTKTSLGVIQPNEFPLTIDVNVLMLQGESKAPLHFSVKLMYPGFYYHILLYDEESGMKGINK